MVIIKALTNAITRTGFKLSSFFAKGPQKAQPSQIRPVLRALAIRMIMIRLLALTVLLSFSGFSYSSECGESFDFAIFDIRQGEWPKSTKIIYSRHGYMMIFEGVGKDKYRFQNHRLSKSHFDKINDLVHCHEPIYDVMSASLSKQERPKLSITASYTKPKALLHSHSIYAAKISEVSALMELVTKQREDFVKYWNYGVMEDGQGYGSEAFIETPDPNYFLNFVTALHYSEYNWRKE